MTCEGGSCEKEAAEGRYFVGEANTFKEISGGYMVGDFMREKGYPQLSSGEVEIAVIDLPVTDESPPHFHQQMTEVTIVIAGKLELVIDGDEVTLSEGQFMLVPPGVVLQNPRNEPGTKVLVVKWPSVPGDKYYVEGV